MGPQKEYEDSNNSSIVLKIAYCATTFLFTGDAEYESETDMLDSGCDLSATVLKVAHHGSNSSTAYRFLRAVRPQYAVISVGEDNPYGHPSEPVLSRLSDADAIVYRTDLNGTIICRSDGSAVTFSIEKDAEEDAIDGNPVADEETYVGNINSKKFHRPSCSNLPAEKNRVLFETRNDALSEGYTPCENCKP